MARKFNYIYSTLVESEDDFIGKIAYTIYKEDKINFIAELKKDNSEKEINNIANTLLRHNTRDYFLQYL